MLQAVYGRFHGGMLLRGSINPHRFDSQCPIGSAFPFWAISDNLLLGIKLCSLTATKRLCHNRISSFQESIPMFSEPPDTRTVCPVVYEDG